MSTPLNESLRHQLEEALAADPGNPALQKCLDDLRAWIKNPATTNRDYPDVAHVEDALGLWAYGFDYIAATAAPGGGGTVP